MINAQEKLHETEAAIAALKAAAMDIPPEAYEIRDLAALAAHPLRELGREIRRINRENGWNLTESTQWADKYKVPAVLALIHSEVSEALEAFRANDGENFCEEMADILIRVLDCVLAFSDDFDAVVAAKLAKNRTRGYRHGGKRI